MLGLLLVEQSAEFDVDALVVAAPVITRDGVFVLTRSAELLRLGARVAICGRTAEKLEVAKAELGGGADKHIPQSLDRVD